MRLSRKTFSIVVISFIIGLITQLISISSVNYSGSFFSKYLNFTTIIPLYIISLVYFLYFSNIKNKLLIIIISVIFSVFFGELAMIMHLLTGGEYTEMYSMVFYMMIPPSIIFGIISGIIISLLINKH
jgi:hypothetical protein